MLWAYTNGKIAVREEEMVENKEINEDYAISY